MEDAYRCIRCNGIWEFCPEDYDYVEKNFPDTCPFCSMPVSQMIHDIWLAEKFKGIPLIIKLLLVRLK